MCSKPLNWAQVNYVKMVKVNKWYEFHSCLQGPKIILIYRASVNPYIKY